MIHSTPSPTKPETNPTFSLITIYHPGLNFFHPLRRILKEGHHILLYDPSIHNLLPLCQSLSTILLASVNSSSEPTSIPSLHDLSIAPTLASDPTKTFPIHPSSLSIHTYSIYILVICSSSNLIYILTCTQWDET